MMTQSYATRGARPRASAAVCIMAWIVLPSACSGVAPSGGRGPLATGFTMNDDAEMSDPVDEAGSESGGEEAATGPMYMGKPIIVQESDASGSIASADGYCPINDMLAGYGIMCPSCAQSHCSDAIGECDPTMVNACAEYYCPTQCPLLDAGHGNTVDPCMKIVQCCPTLLGTPLGLTCIAYNNNSAQSSCQKFLSQAQAQGRCF